MKSGSQFEKKPVNSWTLFLLIHYEIARQFTFNSVDQLNKNIHGNWYKLKIADITKKNFLVRQYWLYKMCNLPQSFSLHTTVQKNIQKPNTINIFILSKKVQKMIKYNNMYIKLDKTNPRCTHFCFKNLKHYIKKLVFSTVNNACLTYATIPIERIVKT